MHPTKPHFQILDGLRGWAALLVVIFHLFEGRLLDPKVIPEHHGYLAVDFFFMLSGYVVGYAYDDRWGRMSQWEFFKIRLIRLHPMLALGVLIGGIMFFLDPFGKWMDHTSIWNLLLTLIIGLTVLPSPDLRGWGETHTLNGPAWTLMQEYIANALYAFLPKKKSIPWLVSLVFVGALALIKTATWWGGVGTGWSYDTMWIAFVRMLFPFFMGLLMFRLGWSIRIPLAFPIAAVLLALLFWLPWFEHNGLYEAACIILAFPVIVAIGAGGQVSGAWQKACKFSGDISYPIYIIHYPFIYWYTEWNYGSKPPGGQVLLVAVGMFLYFILLAHGALKFYDEPLRVWLKKRFLS